MEFWFELSRLAIFTAVLYFLATVGVCMLSGEGSRDQPKKNLYDSLSVVSVPMFIALVLMLRDYGFELALFGPSMGLLLVYMVFLGYGFIQHVREVRRGTSTSKQH